MTHDARRASLPGDSTVEPVERPVPEPGPRPGAAGDEGVVDLRQRHPGDLPRAPRPRARGLPGRDRRPRAVRPGGRGRPGLPPAARGRPGRRLPHRRLRGLRRVPQRLPDRLHRPSRAAYGWQRDGGHADYLLAEENTCLPLPDSLSYVDGALRLLRVRHGLRGAAAARASPAGTRLLVTGLGPVGLAAAMLGAGDGRRRRSSAPTSPPERLRAGRRPRPGRRRRRRPTTTRPTGSPELTGGRGCAASHRLLGQRGRPGTLALASTATWGRCAFVGRGRPGRASTCRS